MIDKLNLEKDKEENHPVVSYLEKGKFEKEKSESQKGLFGFFILTLISFFLWTTEFPFFIKWWGYVTLVCFGASIVHGLTHYFMFEHKKKL